MISSEKIIEAHLGKEVKKLGGLSIKLITMHFLGLPDRLVLLPKARLFFVELKSTGKKPEKIQLYVHKQLRELGFEVYVIDTIREVDSTLSKYTC
jgi:hypothetical protein